MSSEKTDKEYFDTPKKIVTEATKKEYKALLAEKNTLRFRCDCGHEFTQEQPDKKWIRSNHETNFYIPNNDEHGRHTPIRCPKCNSTNGIRRVAPRWNPSTGGPQRRPAVEALKRQEKFNIEPDWA